MAKIHRSVNKGTLCEKKKTEKKHRPAANVYQLLISAARNLERGLFVSQLPGFVHLGLCFKKEAKTVVGRKSKKDGQLVAPREENKARFSVPLAVQDKNNQKTKQNKNIHNQQGQGLDGSNF